MFCFLMVASKLSGNIHNLRVKFDDYQFNGEYIRELFPPLPRINKRPFQGLRQPGVYDWNESSSSYVQKITCHGPHFQQYIELCSVYQSTATFIIRCLHFVCCHLCHYAPIIIIKDSISMFQHHMFTSVFKTALTGQSSTSYASVCLCMYLYLTLGDLGI
jgi:hypothetical protein